MMIYGHLATRSETEKLTKNVGETKGYYKIGDTRNTYTIPGAPVFKATTWKWFTNSPLFTHLFTGALS